MTGFTTIAFGAIGLIAALAGSAPASTETGGSWASSSAGFTPLDFWVED